MSAQDLDSRLSSIAALAEPVRRALYLYVVAQPEPVGREQAAAALGVAHHVAKFNLDRLEEEGLLEVEYSRPPGRGGPGAGRPAKRYRRASREIEVSLPERQYDLAGQILATAIASSERAATPIREALRAAAVQAGHVLGRATRHREGASRAHAATLAAVTEALALHGFQPRTEEETITLANCPFHSLAQMHREIVCGMNLDLMNGLLEEVDAGWLRARLTPTPGMCCVTIEPTTDRGTRDAEPRNLDGSAARKLPAHPTG